MENTKRVILITNGNNTLHAAVEDLLEHYAGTNLDSYNCQKFISEISKVKQAAKFTNQSMLIVIDAEDDITTLKNLLDNISNSLAYNKIPIVVLADHADQEMISHCYLEYVSAVVIKPQEITTLKSMFTNIFDFWLSIATLPKINAIEPDMQKILKIKEDIETHLKAKNN